MMSEFDVASHNVRNDSGLQRLSDFHAALVAMAGHDLRQPLQILVGAHAWLAKRLTEDSEREHLERGKHAVAQLVEQLDHLVEALRIYDVAGDVRPVPVQLAPILAAIARDHADSAARKGVTLQVFPARAVVMSDNVLLRGILHNLVRNALKYTPSGGRVLVGCRWRGTLLRIEVYDTGIGIAANNLAKVFQAFAQLGAAAAEGHGLGLFIVKRAADSLGHRIEVRSTLGRGSCFSVAAGLAAGQSGGARPLLQQPFEATSGQQPNDQHVAGMTGANLRRPAWRTTAEPQREHMQ
jgi:two-component system phosphate regulon sensor histidine kinase PhoR